MKQIKKNKIERKHSIYYDNKNAKKSCPECDSIDTYYRKEIFYCNNCGYQQDVNIFKKDVFKYLGISLLIAILLITLIV